MAGLNAALGGHVGVLGGGGGLCCLEVTARAQGALADLDLWWQNFRLHGGAISLAHSSVVSIVVFQCGCGGL